VSNNIVGVGVGSIISTGREEGASSPPMFAASDDSEMESEERLSSKITTAAAIPPANSKAIAPKPTNFLFILRRNVGCIRNQQSEY